MKICRSNEKKQTIRFDTDPDRTAKVKKTKKKAAFLSVALSGAMIISLFSAVFVTKPETASAAAESLPGIEQIKTNLNRGVQALKILEITDGEKYSAAFGYSIEGQEPIDLANDVLKVAVKEGDETGRLARYNAGNDYFWDLVNRGIINAYAPIPMLSFTNQFMEYYPWDYANYEDLKELPLEEAETVSVQGSYERVSNRKGSFEPTGNSYAVNKENGTYAQDLETYNGSFIPAQNVDYSKKNDHIFYTPSFVQFYVDADEQGNALFYRGLAENGEPDENTKFTIDGTFNGKYVLTASKDGDGEIVSYDYYGAFGSVNRWERKTERDKDGKRVLKPYYYLDSLMAEGEVPTIGVDIKDEESFNNLIANENCFALPLSVKPLQLDSYVYPRYFTFDPKGFKYVGAGNGDYDISVTSVENDNKYKAYNASGNTKFDVTYDKEYYYCDVKNNNLFLKYVLDYDLDASDEVLSRAASGIEVDVVKYSDLSVQSNSEAGQDYDLSAYDLIVLQPGGGKFVFAAGDDGEKEADDFVEKLKAPARNGTAIIFDADKGSYGCDGNDLLTQRIPDIFGSTEYSKEDKKGTIAKWSKTFKLPDDGWAPDAGFDRGYVDGNILFYHNGAGREVFIDNSVSEAIPSSYYLNKGSAFDGVYSEIQYENFLRQREGKTELLDASNIHLGTLIRYILNYNNRRGATDKDTIRILEIEPDNYSQLNTDGKAYPEGQTGLANNTVLSWFGYNKEADNIRIATMSTYEFVGKIDEATSNYDLVYIGSDVTEFNKNEQNVTQYNDTEMNGLVYYNIGDKVMNYHGTFAGLLQEDIKFFEENKKDEAKRINYERYYRYSGNDITEKKYKELRKFADTDFPVIFADDLLAKKGDSINSSENAISNKVDVNSRLYRLMDEIKAYDNVFNSKLSVTQVDSLKKYLSLSKPSIVFTNGGRPADYGSLTEKNPIKDDTLTFEFYISNPTDTSPENTTYGAYLYLDQNGDGLFSESELLSDFIVRDTNGREIKGGNLKGGSSNVYTATRVIDTKSGILPWKLTIKETGTGKNYPAETSEKGWAYKTPAQAISIKVLQIGSNRKDGSDNIGTAFSSQLKEISSDYNITVTYRTAKQVNDYYEGGADAVSDTARDVLSAENGYDMVVLGFDDAFLELSEATAIAVRDFANQGKAVLTSHDTTSFVNYEWWGFQEHYKNKPTEYLKKGNDYIWGYYINKIIRGQIQMDRYGITDTSDFKGENGENKHLGGDGGLLYNGTKNYAETTGWETEYYEDMIKNKGYDVAYQPTADLNKKGWNVTETQGFTDYALQTNNPRISGSNTYKNKYKFAINTGGPGYGVTGTQKVSQANEGQITKYPYNIEGSIDKTTGRSVLDVSLTHYQYYQLNLNSEDIVVWYNLYNTDKNNIYHIMPNDAVNNYYIYSVGNITYTGAGHTGVPTADGEKKLFVNTIVAAYRNANVEPKITFLSGTDPTTGEINTLYLPKEQVSSLVNENGGTGGQDVIYNSEGPGAAGGKIVFRFDDNNMSANKKLYLKNMKIDFGESYIDSIEDSNRGVVKPEFKNYSFSIDEDGYVRVNFLKNKDGVLYKVDGNGNIVVTFNSPGANESYGTDKSANPIKFIDEDGNSVENGEFVTGKSYSIDIGELSSVFYSVAVKHIGTDQYMTPIHLPSDFKFVVTPVSVINGVEVPGQQVELPVKTLDMFDIG